MPEVLLITLRQLSVEFLFNRSHHVYVPPQHTAVVGTDQRFNFLKVLTQVIQNTGQHRAVMSLPVKLVKHLIGITDRRQWLIRTGVGPTRPCVRPIGNHHTKLE